MRTVAINLAIGMALTSLFVFTISARLASGAARESIGLGYPVTANPYLPIQTVEPAF